MPTDTCSRSVPASTNVNLPTPDNSLVIVIRDTQLDTTSSQERHIPTTTRYMRYILKPLHREDPAPAVDELPRLILVMTNTHRH